MENKSQTNSWYRKAVYWLQWILINIIKSLQLATRKVEFFCRRSKNANEPRKRPGKAGELLTSNVSDMFPTRQNQTMLGVTLGSRLLFYCCFSSFSLLRFLGFHVTDRTHISEWICLPTPPVGVAAVIHFHFLGHIKIKNVLKEPVTPGCIGNTPLKYE